MDVCRKYRHFFLLPPPQIDGWPDIIGCSLGMNHRFHQGGSGMLSLSLHP